MTDLTAYFGETGREIGHRRIAAGEARTALIRRRYDAPVEEVWQACTEPERLNRWFLPVSGDLRPGGRFHLEGNAGGEILRCQPPQLLHVTWVYGDRPADEVWLRLQPDDDGGTLLEIEHASVLDVFRNDPETGAWGVGSGWEIPLTIGLGPYLRGELPDRPAVEWFEVTPQVLELGEKAGAAWAFVVEAADREG